jgi:Nif-specific regulatory protein
MLSRTRHDQRSHVELITVYEICRILCASLDIDRTFRAALNVLAAQMDLPRAMIVMADADENALRVHSSVGLSREQEARGQLAVGRRRDRPCLRQGMPVVVPDVAQAPSSSTAPAPSAPEDGRMMAFVVVPLKTDRRWWARWPRSARCRAARACPTTSAS